MSSNLESLVEQYIEGNISTSSVKESLLSLIGNKGELAVVLMVILKELKMDAFTKDTPVILITESGDLDNMEKCLRLGANDCIIKVSQNIGKIKPPMIKVTITKKLSICGSLLK